MEKITVSEARRLRGISQEDAAERLGLSLNGYRKKEAGISKFYLDEATKFCDMVDMNLSDIYFGPAGAENCNEDEVCQTAS